MSLEREEDGGGGGYGAGVDADSSADCGDACCGDCGECGCSSVAAVDKEDDDGVWWFRGGAGVVVGVLSVAALVSGDGGEGLTLLESAGRAGGGGGCVVGDVATDGDGDSGEAETLTGVVRVDLAAGSASIIILEGSG